MSLKILRMFAAFAVGAALMLAIAKISPEAKPVSAALSFGFLCALLAWTFSLREEDLEE